MKPRVLVVDDDASIRGMLVDVLEAEGYTVVAAPDGRRALALATWQTPDVVVTDVWMPEMDGLELVAALEQRLGRAPPVLFMSAAPRPSAVSPLDFLAKPFDLGECVEAVERLCAVAARSAAEAASASSGDAASTTARTVILLFEDEPTTAGLLRDLLEQAGYAVVVAETGAAGLARLGAGGIDLVLLDLILPDLDGLDVCRHLRRHEAEVYLPIIVLTARATAAQRHAGFSAGADDYVVKPFRNEDLLDRVQAWVRVRQRLQASHARLVRAVERRAHDEAVLAMARTAGEHLRPPLTTLLQLVELWRAGQLTNDGTPNLGEALEGVAGELSARLETLERVARYEPKVLGSIVFVDLDRAREATPPTPA